MLTPVAKREPAGNWPWFSVQIITSSFGTPLIHRS